MKSGYLDWSMRRGVVVFWDDAPDPKLYPTLFSVLEDCPDVLYLEATFLSYDREAHAEFLRECRVRGVRLECVPTRLTSRWRKAGAFGEKDDTADARAIRLMVKSGVHTHAPGKRPSPRRAALYGQARKVIRNLRRCPAAVRRKDGSYGYVSQKDLWAGKLMPLLPAFAGLTEVQKAALGSGAGYSPVTVAAVGVAALFAESSREFDYLAGLYAHAAGSQIRADLHHFSWAGGNARCRLGGKKEDGNRGRKDGLRWTDFRRELRWLYHQLRPLVLDNPPPYYRQEDADDARLGGVVGDVVADSRLVGCGGPA